ncbi:MAG: hypothetical protein GX927_11335 [Lentisphaerae bacterium]|nr:hypothetical protein [Lentisphaerota bacterium]
MNAGKSRGNGQGLLNSSKTDNTEKEHGMRHPAYPKYKESGVEWLGKVPEHWAVKRLKYSATINDDTLPETTEPDFEFNYVDIGSVNPIEGITNTETMIFENAPSRARRKVAPGDTIVSTVRTYLRAIAPIPKTSETLIVSTGFAVIRPRKLNADFLAYALRESSFVESVVARSTGVSYPAINASEIGNIEIPLPPEDEQAAIADFLDRETGLIDALAEEAAVDRVAQRKAHRAHHPHCHSRPARRRRPRIRPCTPHPLQRLRNRMAGTNTGRVGGEATENGCLS